MIVVRLCGGLGNQLFQYAVGARLASMHGTELFLEIDDYDNDGARDFELARLLNHPKTIKRNVLIPSNNGFIGKLRRMGTAASRRTKEYDLTIVREKNFRYNPGVLQAHDNTYLIGYWQSHLYLDKNPYIWESLSFRTHLMEDDKKWSDEIGNVRSVSVHIRRGDYVSSPTARNYHGVLPMEYYEDAMKYINGLISDVHFFVFSDDPIWARDNLRSPYPISFLSGGERSALSDMYLMSQCNHHIIANSTFSWWGAWLNRNPGKLVIAPSQWFASGTKIDTSDLMPEDWIKI